MESLDERQTVRTLDGEVNARCEVGKTKKLEHRSDREVLRLRTEGQSCCLQKIDSIRPSAGDLGADCID